jgi:hypothetical protein
VGSDASMARDFADIPIAAKGRYQEGELGGSYVPPVGDIRRPIRSDRLGLCI